MRQDFQANMISGDATTRLLLWHMLMKPGRHAALSSLWQN